MVTERENAIDEFLGPMFENEPQKSVVMTSFGLLKEISLEEIGSVSQTKPEKISMPQHNMTESTIVIDDSHMFIFFKLIN
jgi:hypothetical protein